MLWTFKPDFELKLLFDDTLYLAGYNIVSTGGGNLGLLFHWYTVHVPRADYQLFIHVVDTQTGQMLGQIDEPLSKGTHPTTTWNSNEIVFETVTLPPNLAYGNACHCKLEMGLYQLKDGTRAFIKDDGQHPVGDHVDETIQ